MVFSQGHPEYAADTLFKEYRRDFARFLRGEQAAAPVCPRGYFPPAMEHALRVLTLSIRRGRVGEVLAELDLIAAGFQLGATWSSYGAELYSNWLGLVAAAAQGASPLAFEGEGVHRRILRRAAE
jgi:homoserine O-succinyltransferase